MLALSRNRNGEMMMILKQLMTPIKSIYCVVAQGLMTIMSHLFVIESQSQSTPPSPNRPQSPLDSLPLMFLDSHLKYSTKDTKYSRHEFVWLGRKFYGMPLIKTQGVL